MFEFGRDLRRLFAQARESDDLGWVELIGVDLLAGEARAQAIDAGRVSCGHPFETALRAAALWREHARRTGAPHSLDQAERALRSAQRAARDGDERARLEAERAIHRILMFDLRGGVEGLYAAERGLSGLGPVRRRRTAALAASVHARVRSRLALLGDAPEGVMDAAALMDAALHAGDGGPGAEALRLDRAAMILEAGLRRRDARLLDQAGRGLRELVDLSPEDYRPLTRARALVLCAVGLCALADLAGDAEAAGQGRALFAAAADLFTVDHSPLDWVAVQLAGVRYGASSLAALAQAEALTAAGGLALGALAREARIAAEVSACVGLRDAEGLAEIEGRLLDRVRSGEARLSPLAWCADQIALGRIALERARLDGAPAAHAGLMLSEAETTACEQGVLALAARARSCRAALSAG